MIPPKRLLPFVAVLLALAPPALAVPSYTVFEHESAPCSPLTSCSLDVTLLSPDGTWITGRSSWSGQGSSRGYGRRMNDVGGTWTVGEAPGLHDSDAELVFRHVGLSATNVLAWTETQYGFSSNTYLAPDAMPPGYAMQLPSLDVCLPRFADSILAGAISADGSSVVGRFDCFWGAPAARGAFRWTEASGTVAISPPSDPTAEATAVSDDGSVVAGFVTSPTRAPFVWTSAGGYQLLPITLRTGTVPILSGDGSTLVGSAITANGTEGFVWDAAHGVTHLGDLAGGAFDSRVADVSADGSVVAGRATSASGLRAFVWTRNGGLVALDSTSAALLMTPAGLVLASAEQPNGDDLALWNPANGWVRSPESLLRDAGVAVPTEGLGSAAVGISDDGTVIAGNRNDTSWVATLDSLSQVCDVEMSQPSYADGEDVVITSIRFTNNETSAREARLRLQLTLPFGITVDVLDLGASGGFFVPASFDRELGPVTMFTLQPGQPRGDFAWRCALEDPNSDAILAEDVAAFAFE